MWGRLDYILASPNLLVSHPAPPECLTVLRARLGTAAHFCEVVVPNYLALRCRANMPHARPAPLAPRASRVPNGIPPTPLTVLQTFVSLNLRLKDLLGPVTRVKKKKKGGMWGRLDYILASPNLLLSHPAPPECRTVFPL